MPSCGNDKRTASTLAEGVLVLEALCPHGAVAAGVLSVSLVEQGGPASQGRELILGSGPPERQRRGAVGAAAAFGAAPEFPQRPASPGVQGQPGPPTGSLARARALLLGPAPSCAQLLRLSGLSSPARSCSRYAAGPAALLGTQNCGRQTASAPGCPARWPGMLSSLRKGGTGGGRHLQTGPIPQAAQHVAQREQCARRPLPEPPLPGAPTLVASSVME